MADLHLVRQVGGARFEAALSGLMTALHELRAAAELGAGAYVLVLSDPREHVLLHGHATPGAAAAALLEGARQAATQTPAQRFAVEYPVPD